MNPVLRSQRQAALTALSHRTLTIKARRASGYAMPLVELMGWNREELIACVLDAEYGPLPRTGGAS